MPGDGHCLYHSLGWWASLSQTQVRDQLARVDWDTWNAICPWDGGSELAEFRRETRDPRIWGGALQIAVCAAIHQVSIEVSTDFGKQSFGSGQLWGLRHTSHPAGHYDVVTRDSQAPSAVTRRAKPIDLGQETTQNNGNTRAQAEKPKAKPDSHRPTQWKHATNRLGVRRVMLYGR